MKEHLKRLLPKNNFARNVSMLVGGTAFAQVLTVAVSPLLTRLYSPDDFGILAIYISLMSPIAGIASLRYQRALPLARENQESTNIAALSLVILCLMVALVSLIVFFEGQVVLGWLNAKRVYPYLWLLPAGIFLAGTYNILNDWAVRSKAFSVIARTTLTQSVGKTCVQVAGYSMGPVALITGNIIGQAAGITRLAFFVIRKYGATFRHLHTSGIVRAASRWRQFPLFSTGSALLDSLSNQLPVFIFSAYFGPAIAGIYMLTNRMLRMPMQLIGKSLADVFFVDAVEQKKNGTLSVLVADIHEKLAHIAMPPVVILVLTGPDLFGFIFGSEWRQAGVFAQWLAPWVYLNFITSPLNQLFVVLEKQSHGLMFRIALFLSAAISLFAGVITGELNFTIALYAIGSAVCWAGYLIWLIHISGNRLFILLLHSIRAFLIAIVLAFPLELYQLVGRGVGWWIAAFSASSILIVVRYAWLLRKAY